MRRATPKIISLVLEFCTTWPFSTQRMASACGSGISSAVTSAGPIGQKPSSVLPKRPLLSAVAQSGRRARSRR